MDETTNLVLAFISGPVFLGAIAAVWYYFTKVREPARMKEAAISSASGREMDRSSQMFREGQAGKAQDRQNNREDRYVDFLLASSDGKISEIKDLIRQGNTEQAEQGRLIIASFNQMITLLSQFLNNQPELTNVADYGLALKIKETSINSVEVQQAKDISAAAITNEPADPPGTATIAVTGKQVE